MVLAGVHMSSAAETATIHGAIYEWTSFEPLENVIVEVNSTPPQSMLAKHGIYSFTLEPGDYMISASYYTGNDLTAYTEEEITITDDGDYVLDLILFPTYSDYNPEFNDSEFAELDEIADLSDQVGEQENSSFLPELSFAVILVLILILISGVYFVIKKQKKGEHLFEDQVPDEYPDVASDDWQDLPADLREVIRIIANNDGRITQKDLRSKVKHSEAKVSLMVSDLQSRGIVRKFKKGRGNIIILEEKKDLQDTDDEDNIDNDNPYQNI